MSWYGDLRALHYFPTRRSSDLADADLAAVLVDALERYADGGDAGLAVVLAPVSVEVVPDVVADLAGDDAHVAGRRDRKSTRLNSSHMSISYAVLCWKKKKRTPA